MGPEAECGVLALCVAPVASCQHGLASHPLVLPFPRRLRHRPLCCSKKRREGATRMKSLAGGQQGVEARLESKTHRRVSRRSVKQRLSDLARDVEDDRSL